MKFSAELVRMQPGRHTEIETPPGYDGYPYTIETVVLDGDIVLAIVWRQTPPPIVDKAEPAPKPGKKRAKR